MESMRVIDLEEGIQTYTNLADISGFKHCPALSGPSGAISVSSLDSVDKTLQTSCLKQGCLAYSEG